MTRRAIFIDAGYLLAAGGKACCGSKSRHTFDFDAAAFVEFIKGEFDPGLTESLLRVYWYDGARQGVPTKEQQAIAGLTDVKLRLGRINSHGQQKGVDALIYHDLITLASNRSVTTAVLLSGDEDLREGVRAAQQLGVRVVLVGVDDGVNNQSPELVNEADRTLMLTEAELRPFFRRKNQKAENGSASTHDSTVTVEEAAASFASSWWTEADESARHALLASKPRIPRELDAEVLQSVENGAGVDLRGKEDDRRRMRGAFWAAIRDQAKDTATD